MFKPGDRVKIKEGAFGPVPLARMKVWEGQEVTLVDRADSGGFVGVWWQVVNEQGEGYLVSEMEIEKLA